MTNSLGQVQESISLQRKLYRMAALGIVITTLVIGGIATALYYFDARDALLRKLGYELELQTVVLSTEISKRTDLALQITSRSRIRQELEKYNRGEISQQQLSDFSKPKLQDAMQLSQDIVGITRIGLKKQVLVQVGEVIARANWPDKPDTSGVFLGVPVESDGVEQLVVRAPIYNRNGDLVGTDIVAFSYQTILAEIVNFYNRHERVGSVRVVASGWTGSSQFFKVGEQVSAQQEVLITQLATTGLDNRTQLATDLPAMAEKDNSLFFYKRIGTTPWIFVYRIDKQTFYSPAWRHSRNIVVSMLALMLFGLLIIIKLLRPLSLKLNSLTRRLLGLLGHNRKLVDKLESSKAQLQEIIDNAPAVIYVKDSNGRYLSTNARFEQVTGKSREEVIGKTDHEIFQSQFAEMISSHDADVIQQGCTIRSEQMLGQGGTEMHFLCSKFPLKNASGEVYASCAISTDISEQIHADQRLRQSAAFFESTSEGILITDPDGVMVDVNPALCRMMGYGRDELIGANTRVWKSGLQSEVFYEDMWQTLLTAGNWRGEIWDKTRGGEVIPILLTISSVRNDAGEVTHFVAVYSDISKIKESEMQLTHLAHLAHHDALTGLPNRLLFNDRLNHAIKRAQRSKLKLAVIFMDLDQFKHVNDSLGHNIGDELLIETARLIESLLRNEDTVARIGGDEFTFLVEDVADDDSLILVVEKILLAFDRDFDIAGRQLSVTPSLGISIFPDDGDSCETLLRNADSAMYRAKAEGRNTYKFYTEELTAHTFEVMSLETSLRSAVNTNQFIIHYQPQYDLKTRQLVGMEALVRWQHPELGMVSPDRFIPIAEDSGLIFPLGHWILKSVCQQVRQWLDEGLHTGKVAINISGKQVGRGELVQQLKNIFAETQLEPEYIELEVTESAIMGESARAISELKALRELGVFLAVDDFGTGYSSLTYLKSLPIQKLKIDRSFIKDIPEDANDVAITKAVIALGKSLQLELIAEGVETRVQQDFLIEQGCWLGQGYLLGKPLPADEMHDYLASFAAVAEQK